MNEQMKNKLVEEKQGIRNFFTEFKTFINKGNVVDLAVAVVIGAAFGKIVTAIVSGLITPVIGLLTGGIDLSKQTLTLRPAQGDTPALLLNYGEVLQASIDFIIIAFAIFVLLKLLISMRLKAKDQPAPPAAKDPNLVVLEEIRDLLKKDQNI